MKGDIKDSVKKVMIVFLFFLVALISYIAYFQVFKAPKIAEMPGNQRAWARKNQVLRGEILDSSGKVIAKSIREKNNSQKREYEYGALYAHPIGYISSIYGESGLEASYDKELTTSDNASVRFKKFLSKPSLENLKDAFFTRNSKNKVGNTVVTTLDTKLQKTASEALGDNKGAVVALDPKTGAVLAMVSKPSFNPNNLSEEMQKANKGTAANSPLINRAINGLYPPGSTFKIVTTTSALQNISGIQSRIFNDNGSLTFGDGSSLSNVKGIGNGTIDLRSAFIASSNVVFGTLGMELGNQKLMKTAEKFGFNKDVPANGFNITKSSFPEETNPGQLARCGIGQSSILATPMQMALVASAVANDGVIMEPNLVDKILDQEGNTVETIKTKEFSKVMDKSDAETIKGYMKGLVAKNIDSGTWSYLAGTDAAAKTGTADYNNSDGSPATPHSWFVSFAPADNPKIVVAVIVENGGYGAIKAARVGGSVINAKLGNN